MALSGCRARADKAALAVALIGACAGCATGPVAPAAAVVDAGVELPGGRGREILVRECLECHDLGGLDLFRGFYTRDSWRELVLTMQANGAQVDADEVEIVSDYLATYFSPDSR